MKVSCGTKARFLELIDSAKEWRRAAGRGEARPEIAWPGLAPSRTTERNTAEAVKPREGAEGEEGGGWKVNSELKRRKIKSVDCRGLAVSSPSGFPLTGENLWQIVLTVGVVAPGARNIPGAASAFVADLAWPKVGGGARGRPARRVSFLAHRGAGRKRLGELPPLYYATYRRDFLPIKFRERNGAAGKANVLNMPAIMSSERHLADRDEGQIAGESSGRRKSTGVGGVRFSQNRRFLRWTKKKEGAVDSRGVSPRNHCTDSPAAFLITVKSTSTMPRSSEKFINAAGIPGGG
ncbi:hypothetical protein KM043_000761 [Ampulex compressa]|nr:hypothetical protein KM043_000761 [Ampulex compressa]